MKCCNTAEDHTIKEGVSAEAIVTMHTSGDLTSRIKTFDHFSVSRNTRGVHIDFKATHTIVNHRGDDCNVKLLGWHLRALNDVVVKLFS